MEKRPHPQLLQLPLLCCTIPLHTWALHLLQVPPLPNVTGSRDALSFISPPKGKCHRGKAAPCSVPTLGIQTSVVPTEKLPRHTCLSIAFVIQGRKGIASLSYHHGRVQAPRDGKLDRAVVWPLLLRELPFEDASRHGHEQLLGNRAPWLGIWQGWGGDPGPHVSVFYIFFSHPGWRPPALGPGVRPDPPLGAPPPSALCFPVALAFLCWVDLQVPETSRQEGHLRELTVSDDVSILPIGLLTQFEVGNDSTPASRGICALALVSRVALLNLESFS